MLISRNKTLKFLLPIFTCICIGQIFAFQTNTLRLSVFDQNSAFVANYKISLVKNNNLIKQITNSTFEPVVINGLEEGKYVLEIEAEGFKSYKSEILINNSENKISVNLEIAEVIENVEVSESGQDKSLDTKHGAFTGFLTAEEINALPDDPDELKRAIQDIAGPNAIILVDGFSAGNNLPSKSQIASIKITRSSFDAEYHTVGRTIVDIITKAGNSRWNGSLGIIFNDESFNARQNFAPNRNSSQYKFIDFGLDGPIIKEKASFFLSILSSNNNDGQNINAITTDGRINETINRKSTHLSIDSKVIYNLTKNHPLNISHNFSKGTSKNLGIGGFNLQESGFNSYSSSNRIRISESGLIASKYFHEFRLQFTDDKTEIVPLSDETSIVVINSFIDGGATIKNKVNRKNIQVANNFLFGVKNHALKIGGLIEYEKLNSVSANNNNGTFVFASLENYEKLNPSIFTRLLGSRITNLSQFQIGAYVQDDIRVSQSLLLSLGLRYEWQNNLKDKNNFSPRISFSWSPQSKGETVFRGGIGIYYNWLDTKDLSNILSRGEGQIPETVIINPDFPNPLSNGGSRVLPVSFWHLDDNIKNPYIILGSIGVQRRINKNNSIQATYKFSKGVKQFRSRDLNAPNESGTRPNVDFGRIINIESSAFFREDSLEIIYTNRFSKKLTLNINYVFSKKESDADGTFELPSNNYNLGLDKSFSNSDQRHRIFASLYWTFFKGFSFTTNFRSESALPYTITTGFDNNADTIFNDRPDGFQRNSARGSWFNQFDGGISWTFGFGNFEEGSQPTNRTIRVINGEAPSVDFSKKYSIKLYLNAQNIFNQTNLKNFVGVQSSTLFGQAISSETSRRLNFGMRFSF